MKEWIDYRPEHMISRMIKDIKKDCMELHKNKRTIAVILFSGYAQDMLTLYLCEKVFGKENVLVLLPFIGKEEEFTAHYHDIMKKLDIYTIKICLDKTWETLRKDIMEVCEIQKHFGYPVSYWPMDYTDAAEKDMKNGIKIAFAESITNSLSGCRGILMNSNTCTDIYLSRDIKYGNYDILDDKTQTEVEILLNFVKETDKRYRVLPDRPLEKISQDIEDENVDKYIYMHYERRYYQDNEKKGIFINSIGCDINTTKRRAL